MKARNFNLAIAFIFILIIYSCNKDNQTPDKGSGKISLSLNVNSGVTILSGRGQAVSTDSFKIVIYSESGTQITKYDYFKDINGEVELDTGEYYITAESNDNVSAAFEKPYYFGQSDIIHVVSKDVKPVTITCDLNNFMITVQYSDYVKTNCDSWTTLIYNDADTLVYSKDETRPGYFKIANVQILSKLFYTKSDNSKDTIIVTGSIENPDKKTNYVITIDAHINGFINPVNIQIDETTNSVNLTFTNINLSSSLVAFYPFDANVNDIINGSNGNVTGVNSYGSGADGASNSSFQFVNNEIIDVNNFLIDLNNDYTITCWINLDSLNLADNRYSYIINNRHDASGFEEGGMDFLLHYNNQYLYVDFFKSSPISTLDTINSAIPLNIGNWHFIAFSRIGESARIYIDDQLDLNYSMAGKTYQNNSFWSFGAIHNTDKIYRGLRGRLDQLRFYQRALSINEIDYLFQNKL